MKTGVMDTSALVKFVLPEDHSDAVRHLINRHQTSDLTLLAPDYILVESANVLWKYAQRNNLTSEEAAEALDLVQQTDIVLVPQTHLLADALRFAVAVNITVYDALFSVLAQREKAPLITADYPLAARLAGTEVQTVTLDQISG